MRPVHPPIHGTLTDVWRNLRARRVLVETGAGGVLLRTLLSAMRTVADATNDDEKNADKEVKGTTRLAMRPTSSLDSHAPPPYLVLFGMNGEQNILFYLLFFGMFARLLVRWPRPSFVALDLHARTFRSTSLTWAPSAAAVLKPRLAPATSAYEPPVDQSTNRAHFSSAKFADAPISNRSKMAIPHEYVLPLSSFSAHNCRSANSIPGI